MKRVILVLVLLMAVTSVYSEDIVTVNFDDMDLEDAMSYLFFYGYEAILEESCQGCFLAIDENLNYVGGWRTDKTPDDFAINIPASAVTTSLVFPCGAAQTLFTLLGDYETSAKISGLKEPGVVIVCIFLPEENMVLKDPVYNYGQRLLEKELIRHGLNPLEFYSFMETQGISLDSMVATMYKGEASAQEIVLDGLGRMESQKENVVVFSGLSEILIKTSVVLFIVFLSIITIVIILRNQTGNKMDKMEEDALREEHNKEMDKIEENASREEHNKEISQLPPPEDGGLCAEIFMNDEKN